MAGAPKRRALKEQLARYAELAKVDTPLEFVVAWLEDGHTMLELQQRLTVDTAEDFHQHSVRRYLERQYGKLPVAQAFGEARAEGAHAKVEEAQHLLDTVIPDKDAIAKAKEQANIRLWQAERANKASYGGSRQGDVNVNVTLGQLHLDALRSRVVQAKASIAEVVVAPQLTEGDSE